MPRPTPHPVGWERGVMGLGAERYREALATLDSLIIDELAEKEIPGLAIALVEDSAVLWSAAYGVADAESGAPVTDSTLFRVGSVSKLFTDLALMRLLERGLVSLDEPVARWLPELSPDDPVGRTTLRQLMTHRAGIVREPPVGHYFDATSPGLAATVASLASTPAVYAPGERTKYSNAGVSVVGRVVEEVSGEPFAEHIRRALLRPLEMRHSDFLPDAASRERLAGAVMWAYDRPEWPAPVFELGTIPAGNLYSTTADLARFLSFLLARGDAPAGRLVEAATLDSMWTVQYAPEGARSGYGLGFRVSELDGRKSVSHGGWVYGFATQVAALPDEGIGVAVAATVDGANAVVDRIAEWGLRMLLAARAGTPLPAPPDPTPLPPGWADRLEGRYTLGDRWLELDEAGDRLYLLQDAGLRRRLAVRGDTLVTDGRLDHGARVLPLWEGESPAAGGDARGLVVGGDTLVRTAVPLPPPPPDHWRGLIGEYGWDHNVLYVLEREGELQLLIEWFFYEPVAERSLDHFRLPDRGLYAGEEVTFRRGRDGGVDGVQVGGVFFPRRAVGTEEGATFRITPVRPVEELRRVALAARPPVEQGDFRAPDLVELRAVEPGIRYDIRYAGTNNFMGEVFYTEPRAFLQRPAAEAVARVHRALAERGFGLLIHDAYRPWHVTRMFWDATPDSLKLFVADPSAGSRHNRGAAVDLTLYDLSTGEPVLMPSGYDEFTDRAFPDYPGGTARQRWLRELLRDAMEAEGFTVYSAEWWHFDYDDWRSYPILNRTFEELGD